MNHLVEGNDSSSLKEMIHVLAKMTYLVEMNHLDEEYARVTDPPRF